MPTAAKSERILILCVDRDDDIGMKAGINTPVLGRKENVNAAASLALRDPEEADANAMFEAVRIFDNLRKSAKGEEEYQVATIAGSDLQGVEADRQLVIELTEVLEEFKVISPNPGPEKEAMLTEGAERVHHTLSTLPGKHREILMLRELQGFSYAEIGEILHISDANVKVSLHRARAAFQDAAV
ncbi:MAG: DUF373 family protein, partial [Candidatus Bathyarchaeota archaeon]